MVNIILPIRVVGADGEEAASHFAMTHWSALGYRMTIESVLWTEKGKVSVKLKEVRLSVNDSERIREHGWSLNAWEDEPPSEWFERP